MPASSIKEQLGKADFKLSRLSEREQRSPNKLALYDFGRWSYILYYDNHTRQRIMQPLHHRLSNLAYGGVTVMDVLGI